MAAGPRHCNNGLNAHARAGASRLFYSGTSYEAVMELEIGGQLVGPL